MTTQSRIYMGIDVGSVSLNIAIVDEELRLLGSVYERTRGQPIPVLIDILEGLKKDFPRLNGVLSTGSGRNLIADTLDIEKENEIATQAKATAHFHPEVQTVIEIGGQDSKLIFLEWDERGGKIIIVDHALNEICAAGTGSFLDQQAHRLGISIDEEFGNLALRSKKPATIAGRCSVFAKSDMMHLQQEGIPKEDIVAGLCYALARNYISNLGKGKRFKRPIAFQGGVAANKGVAKAFEELLELKPGELIIPRYFDIMGAFGAAVTALERKNGGPFELQRTIDDLRQCLVEKAKEIKTSHLERLIYKGNGSHGENCLSKEGQKDKIYLGIDVGAVSTNVVILDEGKNLLAKRYLMTGSEPIESVKKGLEDISHEIKDSVEVQGVGVTGSGRYFVGDFVGSDVVVNEITAQARATLDIDKTVDTIFEIGGQDSKYICLKNGSVVDFEMNKVCAAGTGSFLQEQANRLGVSIEEEFSNLALTSKSPVDLGTRCTVFMESDLIHHQQAGSAKTDLLAGLSYSIAKNYLEKVVENKKIGRKIYFQGGVAGNKSVVAAFENILGRDIIVPDDYNVTGAMGAALIAMGKRENATQKSNFAGFHLKDRDYKSRTFECKHCPNHCEIKRVTIGGEFRSFYGGICDRYEIKENKSNQADLPDLFEEREEMLMSYYKEDEVNSNSMVIGIPRMLMFYEQFPLWSTFWRTLGFRVVISDKTNTKLIHKGLQEVLAETCYPMKIAYGHMVNLIEKGVDYIFLPSIIDLKKERDDVARSYNCPFIQGVCFMIRPAFEDKVKILSSTIFMAEEKENLKKQLLKMGREFGKKKRDVILAITAALKAQEEFDKRRQERGQEILKTLKHDNEAVVIIGKPYNVHDIGLNLNLPKKMRKLGMLAIPFDLLPLGSVELPSCYSNLVWKNEQNLLRGAMLAKGNRSLNLIMITNYGCGPDAFFAKYLEDTMEEDPYLVLEVDEHSGDAGMTTRIEAFLDTISRAKGEAEVDRQEDLNVVRPSGGMTIFKPSRRVKELERTLYIPYMSGHSTITAVAFRSADIDAQVLPKPDELSDELGRRYASGKECHPYLLTTGDMVKATQSEGFDPDRSAFFMLNFDGSCRLSQYALSQKLVLKRLGLGHIPVIAPITSIRHDEATRLFGLNWAEAIWKGWLATDVLLKKLLHIRPYEVCEGESERVYERAIEEIASGIVNGNFMEALTRSIAAMDGIPVKRENRPMIGIVGEFYSCINSWANNEIIKQFESLGAEVSFGPTATDYLVYFNEVYPETHFANRKYFAALYYYFRRHPFMNWKGKIEGMLGEELQYCKVPKVEEMVKVAAPYVSDAIDPVVTVNVAKAKNYAMKDYSGIANLIVLNCLYGTLSTAIYKKIQKEHNRIPMLNMIYDGLKQTNEMTRIEAFVHQAKLYHERHCISE